MTRIVTIIITARTSQYIYPLRGFLVQLIPVGCGVPPSLSQAQLRKGINNEKYEKIRKKVWLDLEIFFQNMEK